MSQHSQPDEILVPGKRPLTRSIAEKMMETIERSLDSPLTDEHKSIFEEQLIDEWQRSEESQKELFNAVAQFEDVKKQVAALPKAKQPAAWREFGRQLYLYAQKEGQNEPVGQLILSIYEAKNSILVKGDPPLSKLAAASYVEMNNFMQNFIYNRDVRISSQQKEAIINELCANFRSYDKEIQNQISESDMLWSIFRYNWKEASATEREQFKNELMAIISKESPLSSTTEPAVTTENPPSSNAISDNIESENAESSKIEAEVPSTADQTATNGENDIENKAEKIASVNTQLLAKNSKFMEAIQRLRASAIKTVPFPLKKK